MPLAQYFLRQMTIFQVVCWLADGGYTEDEDIYLDKFADVAHQ
jgi:hypothetical protein